MREAVIILRLPDDHTKARLFGSVTEAKQEFKALCSSPPKEATGLDLWTSDSGLMKRKKLNRPVKAAPEKTKEKELETPPDEAAELRAQLIELGEKPHPRAGVPKLKEALAAALEKQSESKK